MSAQFMPIQPRSVSVRQWFPTPDGTGQPEQVHIVLELDSPTMPALIIRFKSRKGLDAFVADLMANANEVWPEGKP